MEIVVVTIFPAFIQAFADTGLIRKAIEEGRYSLTTLDLREFSDSPHRSVDDSPFGGGPGMVMRPEPFFRAVEEARRRLSAPPTVLLMSPRGKPLTQEWVRRLSEHPSLVFLCPRYEGVDERVAAHLADMEFSAGDYVVMGGEVPAMLVIEGITRLLPGFLNPETEKWESFGSGLLEYPQYTRPREYRGHCVPEVLVGGNHEVIRRWRLKESLRVTRDRRPDLLSHGKLSSEERELLKEIEVEEDGRSGPSDPGPH